MIQDRSLVKSSTLEYTPPLLKTPVQSTWQQSNYVPRMDCIAAPLEVPVVGSSAAKLPTYAHYEASVAASQYKSVDRVVARGSRHVIHIQLLVRRPKK